MFLSSTIILLHAGFFSVLMDWDLPLGAFSEKLFCFLIFPATTFLAASYVPAEHFVKNLKTILIRGVGFTLLSFLIVSTGAAYFLPKLGISSLVLTDYLFVGAIFGSSNLFFTFEDICYDCQHTRIQFEIATAEGVFSAVTTQLLLSLIKGLDAASFRWGFVLRVAAKITISPLIGHWFGRFMSDGVSVERKKEDLQESEIRFHVFVGTCVIYLLAEWFNLNGILAAFLCGIIITRDHLPKIPRYVTFPQREEYFVLKNIIDWLLHFWVAYCLADLQHWKLITSSLGTFVGVNAVFLILLIAGRLPSVYHLSRFVDAGLKKDCEDAIIEGRGTEHVYSCTLARLIRLLETATCARNVLWFSRFMPSVIALVVVLSQFGELKRERQAFLLTGVTSVVYFTNLIYCMWVHWDILTRFAARLFN